MRLPLRSVRNVTNTSAYCYLFKNRHNLFVTTDKITWRVEILSRSPIHQKMLGEMRNTLGLFNDQWTPVGLYSCW